LLSLYKELTGKKIDIPIMNIDNVSVLREAQNIWAKDIEQKKSAKYWIYEIYPRVDLHDTIDIIIRFRWDNEYYIRIKNGERYRTKITFIKIIYERIEERIRKQKRKYNKEAGEEIYVV